MQRSTPPFRADHVGSLLRTAPLKEVRAKHAKGETTDAQLTAIGAWGTPPDEERDRYSTLAGITQPTLVVNGSHDVIMPTVNSFIMEQHIPNAQLIIYPDANHGSQHQYPELFVEHATLFLNG